MRFYEKYTEDQNKLFVVQDNVTQEIRYFGSQCIKKALQIPDSELKREKNKLYAKISQGMNSALWKFDREVIDVEKKRYIASYKKKDIPWEYSPVKKALEKQRLELEKTYLAKLKFLR